MLLVVSGCTPRRSARTSPRDQVCDQRADVVTVPFAQFEAKYPFIPFPLCIENTRVERPSSGDQQFVASFQTSFSINDVRDFYLQQMELLGWAKTEQFDTDEALVRFERPSAALTMVVRKYAATRGVPTSPQSMVTLFFVIAVD